jgi:RNase H-fold protein (predicted Holliday junction resolvase)
VSAKRILRENTKSDTNNYGDDAVSAAVILESYMAYHNRKI